MNRTSMLTIGITTIWLSLLGGLAISAQDKYTVRVPGGLAFSEFRGYESWPSISISRNDSVVAVILGNPVIAGERCQVRVRVPHENEGERLRVYGVREALNHRARSI